MNWYEVANMQSRVLKLERALGAYVTAQSRMRDGWAEGDDARKTELWRGLHECENLARELLGDYSRTAGG